MIKNPYIEIRTDKFQVLPGEDDEIVNEGMYGKALCSYIAAELSDLGFSCPPAIAEDWGWWQEVNDDGFSLGLQIYSQTEDAKNPHTYIVCSSDTSGTKWNWKKLKKIDFSDQINSILKNIETLFKEDPEILFVKRHIEMPLS